MGGNGVKRLPPLSSTEFCRACEPIYQLPSMTNAGLRILVPNIRDKIS